MRHFRSLFLIFFLASSPSRLAGQPTSGSILGVVQDPSGAAAAGVAATVENEATGWRVTGFTNEQGRFAFSDLLPGSYRLILKKTGFKAFGRSGIILALDQKLSLDLQMQLGEVDENIIVTSSAVPLETQDSGNGHVITGREILDLPLLGRNFLDLAKLAPGVAAGGGGNNANLSVNGQREFGNSLVVNGVEVTGNRNNDTSLRPSVDAVEEFKALTSSFAPEFGRAIGGVIAVQTKSGTNVPHGSVYEFLRNNVTTARTFFAAEPAALKQNNFGASLGGPIVHNRTFLFGSYEGLRLRDVFSYLDTTIPTEMLRISPGGSVDLSGLKDPYTGNRIPVFDPSFYGANRSSEQFPGNLIPASRVSPAGRGIVTQLFPQPDAPGTLNGWFSNLQVGQRYRFGSDTAGLRLDHAFTEKDRLSATYDVVSFNGLTGDRFAGMIPFPGGGSGDSADVSDSMNQSAAVSYVRVIGPTRLNDLRVAFVRASFFQNDLIQGTDLARQFGIANANIDGYPQTSGFPQIQLASGATTGGSTYKPLTFLDQNLQIGDTFSWSPSRHTVRLGYEYRRLLSHPNFSLFPAGYQYYYGPYSSMTGDPTYTFYDPNAYYGNGGNEVADLFLGLPGWVAQGLQLTKPKTGSHEHEFFAQDAWQATRALVITFGVRYEYQAPYTASGNQASNFDVPTLRMLLAGVGGNSQSLVRPDCNNFAPRVGLAWRVRDKTILRVGWGFFYTPENSARSDVLTKNYPFFTQQNFENYPGTLSYMLDAGSARPTRIDVPTGVGSIVMASVSGARDQSVYSVDQALQTGYAQVSSFTVQHNPAPGVVIEAGYSGALAHALPYAIGNLNRGAALSKQLGAIQAQVARGESQYHALQSKIQKRFSRGFGLLAAYTYSKNMDNGPAPFNLGRNHQQPQDPLALDIEHALSTTDQPHNLVMTSMWSLPFARRTRGWRRSVFGGWQLNGIGSLHSGLPVNVVRNGSVHDYEGLRPNALRDPALSGAEQTLTRYFDTAAFWVKGLAPTQPGNAGRNIVRGPGFAEVDLSFMKHVQITDTRRFELRVESFNVANRPNFASPNSDMSQGNFGQITNTAGIPRIVQFAVKYRF